MNRNRTLVPIGVVAAVLAAGAGVSAATRPGAATSPNAGQRRVAVQSRVAVCPDPDSDGVARSWVTAAAPPDPGSASAPATGAGTTGPGTTGRGTTGPGTTGAGATATGAAGTGAGPAGGGQAAVTDLASAAKVRLRLNRAGAVTTLPVTGVPLPPQVGRAQGAIAAGFTLQQTTRVAGSRIGRGLAVTPCAEPDTDFWFAGASTLTDRHSSLLLTDSEQVPASVDLILYGPGGPLDTPASRGLLIGPGHQRTVLLGALAAQVKAVAVHVVVRSGRVAAALRDEEVAGGTGRGVDWLPPAAPPARRVLVPAAPGERSQKLYLLAPGDAGGTARIRLIAKEGPFAPAGADSVQLAGGRLAVVDLGAAAHGEPVAVAIDADVPVVAGSRVVHVAGGTDVGYLAGGQPLSDAGVIADVSSGPSATSTLYLTAPQGAAQVSVGEFTATGRPVERGVTVPAGVTVTVPLTAPPGGKPGRTSQFAVVITPGAGGGPVYGSWSEADRADGGDLFTTQPVNNDGATLLVPRVGPDLSAGINQHR